MFLFVYYSSNRNKCKFHEKRDTVLSCSLYAQHLDQHQENTRHSLDFLLLFFKAAPTAYGGSQARGLIAATAAGLHHHNSNALNTECCQGCREIGTHVLCWWECKMVQLLWWFLKKLNMESPCDPTVSFLGIHLNHESRASKRYFYTYVHSSTIHNSQKVEATWASRNRWWINQV